MNIQHEVGITFVIVTHDQEEAMTVSSRIAVMDHGRIVQVGTPAQVYEYPNSRYVAEFVGDVNLIEGRIAESGPDHALIESAECTLRAGHGVEAPAVMAGWLLSFTLSLDDLVIASFTTGPGATTLPMKIYSQVRLGVTPEINAVSTILIGIVATRVLIASLVAKRQEVKRRRDDWSP